MYLCICNDSPGCICQVTQTQRGFQKIKIVTKISNSTVSGCIIWALWSSSTEVNLDNVGKKNSYITYRLALCNSCHMSWENSCPFSITHSSEFQFLTVLSISAQTQTRTTAARPVHGSTGKVPALVRGTVTLSSPATLHHLHWSKKVNQEKWLGSG